MSGNYMTRYEAEKTVASINAFWRKKGYLAGARVEEMECAGIKSFCVRSNMVNGVPTKRAK